MAQGHNSLLVNTYQKGENEKHKKGHTPNLVELMFKG